MQPDAVGLGEVPVRLPKMIVSAKEVEPLRHVEPVAGADDDQIRLGKRRSMRTAFAVSTRYLPNVLCTSASTSAMSARIAMPRSSIARGRNCV